MAERVVSQDEVAIGFKPNLPSKLSSVDVKQPKGESQEWVFTTGFLSASYSSGDLEELGVGEVARGAIFVATYLTLNPPTVGDNFPTLQQIKDYYRYFGSR